jgi:hypothetical protein
MRNDRRAHTFRVSIDVLERLKEAAGEDLRSMNASAELALRAWLRERNKDGIDQREAGSRQG